MKLNLIAIVALCATSALGGWETKLTMENDTFLKKDDSDYTHGTKLDVVDRGRGLHYILQQTMYAPPDLSLKHHVPGDRPYAGVLLGGVGYEFFRDVQSPWSHYGEFNFGVIGPSAGCKETQTFIHKILHCHKPMGWDDQLHDEPILNAQWWTRYSWFLNSWVAIVPKAGVTMGNLQDFGEIGCDLKVGWNIERPTDNGMIFSAVEKTPWQEKLSAYAFVGASERYYIYNHILQGSMFNHKDDNLKVGIERWVSELRVGLVFRYSRFFATYYAIFRTDEYKRQERSPDFGGIGIGWIF